MGKDLFCKNSNAILAVALIAVGVIFCALRSEFVSVLLSVVGTLVVLLGIFDLIEKRWTIGGVKMAVGIIVIVCGWLLIDVSLLMLGIVLCIYAIYSLISQISLFKRAKINDKVFILLYPIVQFVLGILLIVARWYMLDAIFIVLGILLILYGISLFFKRETVK